MRNFAGRGCTTCGTMAGEHPLVGKGLGHCRHRTTADYTHLARDAVKTSAARFGDSIAHGLDTA